MSSVQSVDLTELALNYDDKRRMEPQDFERTINRIRQLWEGGGRCARDRLWVRILFSSSC
jgi:hypothetical protein